MSPVRAVAPIPAEATGRESVMSGLPAGGYTIGFVPKTTELKRPVQQVQVGCTTLRSESYRSM
jgi:hypothetical protein